MKKFFNNHKKIFFEIIAIILIAVFSYSIAPKTLQNDTYYTIRIGEHIINNGIDMKDPFSWHEDLAYTYPHWAYDTGLYLIYKRITSTDKHGIAKGKKAIPFFHSFFICSHYVISSC